MLSKDRRTEGKVSEIYIISDEKGNDWKEESFREYQWEERFSSRRRGFQNLGNEFKWKEAFTLG